MKRLIALLLAVGVGYAAASVIVSHRLDTRHAAERTSQQTAWQAEKEQLQAELDQARQPAKSSEFTARPADLPTTAHGAAANAPAPVASATASKLAPPDLLERLKAFKLIAGPGGAQSQREMVRLLDDLVHCGPAALPAIREYLASKADVELAQGGKGKGPPGQRDSLLPSTLRAGLLSALQEIGGPEAEQLLAQSLGGNSRPDEVLKLAQMLEQMAPGKYRDTALAAAQAQLSGIANQGPREAGQLYEVLAMYGGKSYAEQARTQLLQADGRLNKEALDYLQTTLKQENLPLLKELLQSPQITDPKQKEDLVRYVAELAGTDQQANQLWYESALNANLSDKARERAIRELEARGFQNQDNPTASDLQLAQSRLQLLEALRAQVQDPNQLTTLDQTRARLTIMMDPNLRQALHGQPKGPKMP
jgi:hypothetical protein